MSQLSEQFWITLIQSGPTGVVTVGGFVVGVVGSVVAAVKGISNGRKATKIQKQTDGRFSQLIETIQGLTSEVAAERGLREQREKELTYALSVLSARLGKPIATIRAMVRAEDFGETGRWPGPDPAPRRRRVDRVKLVAGDREGDQHGDG